MWTFPQPNDKVNMMNSMPKNHHLQPVYQFRQTGDLPVISGSGFCSSAEEVHHFSRCTRTTSVMRHVALIFVGIRKFSILLQDTTSNRSGNLRRLPG